MKPGEQATPTGGAASGAREGASGTPGATQPALNASKRVSKRFGGGSARGLPPHKVALIHVAKAKTGMAEETYRAILRELGGVSSSVELSNEAFAAVMERFKALGFVHSNAVAERGLADSVRRPGMATLEQRKYIRGLWRKWHGADDGRALGRWLERKFQVTDLRFATVETARMAIEGLKAMVARKSADESNGAASRPTKEV